jgi:acetylornithine deacetylase/succinyl-diaminopimelate desuccinylase-like protein
VSAVVELTSALIAAASPNPPGDEREAARVATDALPVAPRVLARSPERPNLLATLDFGPGGRHLVLCGHLDTKPVGGASWSVDPFAATIEGDRLYGLGAVAARRALGGAAPDSVFPGTTDATWLAPVAPTLPALGPGLLSRAHAADEWVSVAALERAVELYVALAEEYCAG